MRKKLFILLVFFIAIPVTLAFDYSLERKTGQELHSTNPPVHQYITYQSYLMLRDDIETEFFLFFIFFFFFR